MNILKDIDGNKLTLSLDGRLDTVTAPEFEAEIPDSLREIDKLVLDLEELEYISSAGLRVILSLHKKMGGRDAMVIRNCNETVMDVFKLTGFSDIMTME